MQTVRPLGVSTSLFRGTLGPDSEPEGIDAMRGTGITHIEYFCDDDTRNHTSAQHMAAVKRAAVAGGVTVWSCHAPFGSTDISADDEAGRRQSVQNVIEALDAAVELGAGRVVVHGSREPIAEEDRERRLIQCIRSLNELCKRASQRGLLLALELLPRTCLGNRTAEMQRLLAIVDGDLRICYDVNHITLYEGVEESLSALEGRIETLHISDHDGVDERHWIPGRGIVDWPGFVAGLDAIGYSGCLLHEASDSALDLAGNLREIAAAAERHLQAEPADR